MDENYVGQFVGCGKYKPTINGNQTKSYKSWHDMFTRCYYKNQRLKYPTYENCEVCEEWFNFQNFAKWYEENKWDENLKLQVDKDILFKGNKIYSPETCIFVDSRINCLFTKSQNKRGTLPIGVRLHKVNHNYVAQCSVKTQDGKKSPKHLGSYSNPNEAFRAYKTFKESYIKQVADEYKQKYPNFPQKLYDAMYNWEVEITD